MPEMEKVVRVLVKFLLVRLDVLTVTGLVNPDAVKPQPDLDGVRVYVPGGTLVIV